MVDAVDKIKATTQRIPNLDIAKVGVDSGLADSCNYSWFHLIMGP